jgi:regulatory protein
MVSNESVITAIKGQQHDRERVNVFVDGEYAFAVTAELAVLEGLRIGDAITPARIAELQAKDEQSKAVNSALLLLTTRPRSIKEIRTRLKQKGYSEPAIDAAIEKAEGWNYVDDEAFARFWVENREANRPRGRRLLEQELRDKGVDREIVRNAIDEAGINEIEAATELARAKMRSYAKLEPEVARRRLAGFLARKGYNFEVVKPAIAAAMDDELEPEESE